MTRYGRCILLLTIALVSGGCGADSGQRLDGDLEVRAAPDTVVTTGSGLIGGLVDWSIGPEGSVFLLDGRAKQVHVTDSTGRFLRSIGRPGQGPGELERPASIHLSGDLLTVVDPGNGRLQAFKLDGEPASSRTIPACASGPAPPAVGPDGILVRPTLGFDAGLAIVCSSSGEERARLGELLAPGEAMVDMSQMRAQIREGEVPAMLLNAADAVVAGDGTVWLVLSAAAQIESYDPSGQRLARVSLNEPEFEAVRAAWVERNAELAGPGVASLNHILSARAIEDELWVLTNTAGQAAARLLVISDDGGVRRQLHFTQVEGAGDFVVDEDRGWVYFYSSDNAEVLRVSLNLRSAK